MQIKKCEQEIIKFGVWLTGHEQKDIEQMLNDYNNYKDNKSNLVEARVSPKTADDKYLYWKSTVVQDDDLRYGDKPKKQYFRTICFDNQQTMIEPSIKLKADNLEIGTVVEIYLPKC